MKLTASPLSIPGRRAATRSAHLACSISLGLLLLAASCSSRPADEPSGTVPTAAGSSATTEVRMGAQPSLAEAEPQKIADQSEQSVAQSAAPLPYTEALTEFNRGAAFMEQYEYAQAAEAYIKVAKMAPEWTAARFNLALAYMNMVGENNPQKRIGTYEQMVDGAVSTLESLLKDDPDNPRYLFCLGMIKSYLGEAEQALECFQQVYTRDTDDNFAAFCYAKALSSLDRFDEATPLFERIVERDPGFISAVHKLAEAYSRAKKVTEARSLIARHGQLRKEETAVGAYVVEDKYGMAGKYYFVLGADGLPLPPPQPVPARRILFAPETRSLDGTVTSWKYDGGTVSLAGLAVADVDADQDLDLLITGIDADGQATLYLNDGTGHFARGATLADKVVSPSFGDIDNDGDVDLWLGRWGADQILLNDGQGGFQAAAEASMAGADVLTPLTRLADIDSDGDLDLIAMRWMRGSLPAGGTRPRQLPVSG